MTEKGYPRIDLPAETEDWLSDHPNENRTELEEVWQLTGLADDPFSPDPTRVDRIRKELDRRISSKTAGKVRFRIIRPTIWLAAAAVIVVALGINWWMQPIRYSAPVGQMLAVNLSDGSNIILNSGSTLERSRTFGWWARVVNLTGEAFFDVAKGQGRFEVATFNGRVAVLGTRFNVRSWSTDAYSESSVFVEEGVVRLAARENNNDFVVLTEGEAGAVRPGSPSATPLRDQEAPSWRSGGMDFSDKPLGVVIDEIERRHGVVVTVAPDSLENTRVSLHLGQTAEAGTILDMLAAVHDLELTQTPHGYQLKRK